MPILPNLPPMKIIADHESAHALAAWFYGLKISEVKIFYDPLCSAGEDKPRGHCVTKPPCHAMLAAEMYCSMAGSLMDELNEKKDFRQYSLKNGDFALIQTSSRLSHETLKMYEWFRARPDGTVADFIKAFKKPVLRLLKSRKGRRAVTALSSELMKTGLLSGVQSVSIIEKAWGVPLPKTALPNSKHGVLLTNAVRTFDDLISRLSFYVHLMDDQLESLSGTLSDHENDVLDGFKKPIVWLKLVLNDAGRHGGDK